ncbi:hypothetical protein ACJMK2_029566 [Sinanodonta woodiana]|uniref:G-protein coupled receptors family 1 profile domain-containing protein n=1 Tax=Sinanodonta woodiana TaxID=1069815 RepID=A0ABD3XE68_SINWO
MVYSGSSTVNFSDLKSDMEFTIPQFVYQSIAGLLIISVAVGFLGNALVAVTIFKNKLFHVLVYALLLQVAVIDALFQVIVVPVNIYSLFQTFWKPSTTLCNMMAYASYMLRCTSGLLLIIISVYRCVILCYNKVYMRIRDPRVVTAACLIAWIETLVLISVLGNRASFSLEYMTCVFEGVYLQRVLLILIYLPVSCIPIAMYIKIAVFVRKANRRVMPRGITSLRNYQDSNKLTKTTALILFNHLMTWLLPGIFLTVIQDDHTRRVIFIYIAHLLIQLTSAFDFIILFLSNKTIRGMILNLFKSTRHNITQRGVELQQSAASRIIISRIQVLDTKL